MPISDDTDQLTQSSKYISTNIETKMNSMSSDTSKTPTESVDVVSTNNTLTNLLTQSSSDMKQGFTTTAEENLTRKSVTNYSRDIIGRSSSNWISSIATNGSHYTASENQESKSVSTVTADINHVKKLSQSSEIKKTTFSSSHKSQTSRVSATSESFITDGKKSINLRSKMKNQKFFTVTDIIVCSLMAVAILVLLVEIERRRKISHKLRNFLFRI
ncbi:hypothetical protein RF11_03077 [Thelohanellus kitauei]|uniref:Uncharacterized protein n=1 Tax=Thelohanellus kitauei TaxID=669202 RepID=A0A0C2JK19_THEKT|nr:hypothetical protein RF11_03077 [Thelohanellus kitauei]